MHVKHGELQADFEGSAEAVSIAFLDFLNTAYPAFKLASRLLFKPDVIQLAQALEGVIEFAPDGILLTAGDLTSEEAIVLTLLGVYVGHRLGVTADTSLSVTRIATACGKASKTVLNQLKGMIDDGLLERVGRGEYQIKSQGIKRAEQVLHAVKGRDRR